MVTTMKTDPNHVLLNADVFEALSRVEDSSIDLVFVDPPYNIGKDFKTTKDKWANDAEYLGWCYTWLDMCLAKLKPNGSMYLMAATQNMPFLDIYIRERVTVLSRIIWSYDSSGVQARKYFGSMYEPILFAVKDPTNYTFNADAITVEAKTGAVRKLVDYRKATPAAYSSKKVPGNVWYCPRVRYRMPEYEEHPSQKPEGLMERIIAASSNEGDIVLDPFAGTFTTCAVAQRMNRRSIGIEIDPTFYSIGMRRLQLSSPADSDYAQPPRKTYVQKNIRSPAASLFDLEK